MTDYDIPLLLGRDSLVNTNNDSMLKKVLYIVFSVLPATLFSFISLLMMGGILSIETLFIFIFITATLSGTAGLYFITFSKEHDSKFVFILLVMGQLAMLVVIGFLIFSIVSSGNLSLDSIFYLGLTKPYELIIFMLVLVTLLGPIAVALHYQLTTYERWKLSMSKGMV